MQGQYNFPLVILSYCVAVLAAHVALLLAGRLRDPLVRSPILWTLGGALSMGTGIWSMHFVGMLAFHLPILVFYDWQLTTFSWVIAVAISGFALQIIHRGDSGLRSLLVSGVLMGLGISAMHYTGMAAMKMSPEIRYSLALFALSIVIAIAASVAALWIALNLGRIRSALRGFARMGAALVMGAAIAGMHYCAMAAANFDSSAICGAVGWHIDPQWLAYTIASFTVLFLLGTTLISVVDARLGSALSRSADKLRQVNEELERRVVERTANLAREEARKSAILMATVDCIIASDAAGLITEFNVAAERTFGYSRDDAIGRPIAELIIPVEQREQFVHEMQQFIATGSSSLIGRRIEVAAMRKNATTFPAELAVFAVKVDGDVFFTAQLSDITTRKQMALTLQSAKEAAEDANNAKSEFLANMSHELRTPMHAVISYAQLGVEKAGGADAGKLHKYFNNIHTSANRLLVLLDDLLDLSKFEAGRMILQIETCNLVELAREAVTEASALAQKKGISVMLEEPDTPVSVSCDFGRILQIVRNLLSNAIKFSPEGSVVFLRILDGSMGWGRRDVDHVAAGVIEVVDQGVGIPEDELEAIFDKFVQSTKTRSGAGGTGLGLAICRQIVRVHRGTIVARNNTLRGATFIVTIPVSASQENDPTFDLDGLTPIERDAEANIR